MGRYETVCRELRVGAKQKKIEFLHCCRMCEKESSKLEWVEQNCFLFFVICVREYIYTETEQQPCSSKIKIKSNNMYKNSIGSHKHNFLILTNIIFGPFNKNLVQNNPNSRSTQNQITKIIPTTNHPKSIQTTTKK